MSFLRSLVLSVLIAVIVLAGLYLLPWDRVSWGKFSILPGSTITVTGESKQDISSQIASFNVGVTATNQDKQKALDEVNSKMTALLNAVKTFGIANDDIKTQNVSVYQSTLPYPEPLIYPPSRTPSGLMTWSASNSIEIKLRKIDRSSEFTDLLNKSGATSINGPNYSIDDTTKTQIELLSSAIENARKKADEIAKASGRTLGKAVNIIESGSSYPGPLYLEASRGIAVDTKSVPTPVEPGTQTVYKSVTVTYELN